MVTPIKAMGLNSQLLLKRNDTGTYGGNSGGNFNKVQFNSANPGPSQPLVEDPQAGQGRDPLQQFPGPNTVAGSLSLPVDIREAGFHLTGLLGDATTTVVGGVYTHVFKSGALVLPDYAMEVGHLGPIAFYMNTGIVYDSIAFKKAPGKGGPASMTASLMGQSTAAKAGASGGGAPVSLAPARAVEFQGVLKKAGAALANITDFDFTYSNNFASDRDTNSTGDITAVAPGTSKLSGKMTSRYVDTTLTDLMEAQTRFDLELVYTYAANMSLTLRLEQIALERTKPAISGPAGYDMPLSFAGEYNAGNTAMVTFTLINDQPAATYT